MQLRIRLFPTMLGLWKLFEKPEELRDRYGHYCNVRTYSVWILLAWFVIWNWTASDQEAQVWDGR